MPQLLLVEDDRHVRQILAIGLRLEGFEVQQAENGQAGIERLKEGQFDAIVADLMMPVMDGRAFLREARQGLGSDTPVLMLTSVDRPEAAQDLMEDGASAILLKPVLAAQIAETIRDLS